MKTFYTSRDIDDMVSKGTKELVTNGDASFTDEALDRAARLGLEIRHASTESTNSVAIAVEKAVANDSDVSQAELAEIVKEIMNRTVGNGHASAPRSQSNLSKKQLLIGGRWTDSASGKFFAVRNPANNQIIAEVAEGGPRDVDAAVEAARKAFEEGPWGSMSAQERGQCLYRLAELIRKNNEKLALVETLNAGKPITQTRLMDLSVTADTFEYYAGAANKIEGRTMPVPGNFLNYTLREPLGVVGIIVPWNFPLMITAWKLAPALAAGNTVIIKPASLTPLSALELGALCLEAGIPEGVVNVLPGPGGSVGDALVGHSGVAKIGFTGETGTGRGIAKCGADTIKKISLELGGKSPNIVFEDADIDRAVAGSLFGIFLNAGEVCAAGSRLFLHERIHDAFMEKFVNRAKAIRVGDTMCEKTQMGPVISTQHLEKVKGYIQSGIDQGARLLVGGTAPSNPDCAQGNYLLPTIFDRVTMDMKIAQEEIFGPVVAVLPFRDEEEVIKKANTLIYGLAAGMWTNDLSRAHKVARRIHSGSIWINSYALVPVEAPFGGYKQSGIGRDLGFEALDSYLQTKNISVDLNEQGFDFFSLW